MKQIFLSFVMALIGAALLVVRPVLAQTETPPIGPMGEIRGSVMNSNTGTVVAESMDVMLHVLNQDYVDMDMQHGQSQPDGTFVFSDVPFSSDLQFAVMATFDGVSYFSDTAPANMETLSVSVDVPVYETTKDLSNVQVDQMHILFELSTDGLETRELYIISSKAERTVKDVFDLGENQFATLRFPLPADADYIFFKPDASDRFIKQDGGFADTYPIVPGGQPSQVMVSYLVPFSGERTYSYTAPLDIAQINVVIPEETGLSLTGTGLTGPESMTLQDGLSYQVYGYSNLKAGQTLDVTFSGSAAIAGSTGKGTNNLVVFGVAFLGFAVIGAGIWWWRKANDEPEDETHSPSESTFDELINEIAILDETYEQRGLSDEQYQEERRGLLQRAKRLSPE
jgi:hypothetical protein